MKATCTQENLSKALSFLERATGRQTALPILSNFLLRTENGKLKLSSTNLEIGVTVLVNSKIEGSGEIVAPLKVILNFIGNLPQGEVVSLDIDKGGIMIESGRYDMKVRGFDPKDFPIIPERKSPIAFTLPAQSLRSAIQKVVPCISTNESRIELTGVNMTFREDSIRIAATDSFRLAEQILRVPAEYLDGYEEFRNQNASLILPYVTMQELIRIISPDTKDISVTFEENQIFFDVDGVSVVSRLINGKYPDYEQILPSDFTCSVKLLREEFLRSVRMSGNVASQVNGEMRISILPNKDEIQVAAKSSDVEGNKAVLQGEISCNESMEVVFNPRYVIDGLNTFSSEYVSFLLNSSASPAGFRAMNEDGVTDSDYLYIVMPIRK